MGRKRQTAEQIIAKLREAEVDLASGQTAVEVARNLGIKERIGNTVRPGPAGRRELEDCDGSMKLRLSSSGCETRLAMGEPARAGSEPCDGLGNEAGEA